MTPIIVTAGKTGKKDKKKKKTQNITDPSNIPHMNLWLNFPDIFTTDTEGVGKKREIVGLFKAPHGWSVLAHVSQHMLSRF